MTLRGGSVSKDPDARLDWTLDWDGPPSWDPTVGSGPWLEDGDTISASEWVAETGITICGAPRAPSFTGTTTRVWLEGGTVGASYEVRNRVTTGAGRIDDCTITVQVTHL